MYDTILGLRSLVDGDSDAEVETEDEEVGGRKDTSQGSHWNLVLYGLRLVNGEAGSSTQIDSEFGSNIEGMGSTVPLPVYEVASRRGTWSGKLRMRVLP